MILKEARALAPAWLATVSAMLAAEYLLPGQSGLGEPVYFIGGVALGALVIGREYGERTLSMLLAQPVRRERILLVKLGVLAALLLALAAVAATLLPFPRVSPQVRVAVIAVPVLCGLFLAPWLTMVTRSAIGGAVFPVAIVGIVMLAGDALSRRFHGYTHEGDAFRLMFMWWTMGGLVAVGAIQTWRTFLRLEAIDGTGGGISVMPGNTSAATARTHRHPIWLLVRKELRLQQLAFAVAAVYVVFYVVAYFANLRVDAFDEAVTMATILYGGLIALLIGALASAEERQLGTLEWQTLLPMATWQQWLVKTGTAIGLALLLGVGLPWLLVSLLAPEYIAWARRFRFLVQPPTAVLIVVFTTIGLYLSTLSRSAMWALIASLPVIVAGSAVIERMTRQIERAIYRAFGDSGVRWHSIPGLTEDRMLGLLLAVLLALVIYLALQNHRSAERGVRRAMPHLAIVIVCAAAGYALAILVRALR